MRDTQFGRLNKLFEAIDSDDTTLFWSNRRQWKVKHGYIMSKEKVIRKLKTTKSLYGHMARECMGEFDENHTFCVSKCCKRHECKTKSEKRVKK